MRLLIIVFMLLVLTGCRHPYIGLKNPPHHQFDQIGHYEKEYEPGILITYDYRVINDKIEVDGIITCAEHAYLGTWDHSEIKINFIFHDNNDVIVAVERISVTSDELCKLNRFKRSFSYNEKYRAVSVEWQAEVQAN